MRSSSTFSSRLKKCLETVHIREKSKCYCDSSLVGYMVSSVLWLIRFFFCIKLKVGTITIERQYTHIIHYIHVNNYFLQMCTHDVVSFAAWNSCFTFIWQEVVGLSSTMNSKIFTYSTSNFSLVWFFYSWQWRCHKWGNYKDWTPKLSCGVWNGQKKECIETSCNFTSAVYQLVTAWRLNLVGVSQAWHNLYITFYYRN